MSIIFDPVEFGEMLAETSFEQSRDTVLFLVRVSGAGAAIGAFLMIDAAEDWRDQVERFTAAAHRRWEDLTLDALQPAGHA